MTTSSEVELRERARAYLRDDGRPDEAAVLTLLDAVAARIHAGETVSDPLVAAVLRRELDVIGDRYADEVATAMLELAIPEGPGLSRSDDEVLQGVMSVIRAVREVPVEPAGVLDGLRPGRLAVPGGESTGDRVPPRPPAEPSGRLPRAVRVSAFDRWWARFSLGMGVLAGAAASFLLGLLARDAFHEIVPSEPPALVVAASSPAGPASAPAVVPPGSFRLAQAWPPGDESFDFRWPDPPRGIAKGVAGATVPPPVPDRPAPDPLQLSVWIEEAVPDPAGSRIRVGYRASRPARVTLYLSADDQRPRLLLQAPADGEIRFHEWTGAHQELDLLGIASDETLVLESEALDQELTGIRSGRVALEALRSWAFQEARSRQTTLALARDRALLSERPGL